METPTTKYTTNSWKDKLRLVQAEKKYIKKKLFRTQSSRDKYKAALKDLKAKYIELSEELSLYTVNCSPVNAKKPKGHYYSLFLIHLAVYFQSVVGLSYRCVQEVLHRFILVFGLETRTPCISTIRYWVHKVAYHRLNDALLNSLGDKVLIIDECAGIGQETLLLVLGVSCEHMPLERSLRLEDTDVLALASRKSWNAEQIAEVLTHISENLAGSIRYIISDRGSNLVKGIGLAGYVHVPDCTHFMGAYLRTHYSKDEGFRDLQHRLGKLRQKWVNGKNTVLAPPRIRSKARFLNLFEIVDWMKKILSIWHTLDAETQEILRFLQQHQPLIEELDALHKLIKDLAKLWKMHGFSLETEVLTENMIQKYKNMVQSDFCVNIAEHQITPFSQTLIDYLRQVREALPEEDRILCCSDIIESYFGKFKYRSNQGCASGISDDMLVLTLFKGQLSKPEVCQALEEVSVREVKRWADQNTVPSFAKAKKTFWQNLGTLL